MMSHWLTDRWRAVVLTAVVETGFTCYTVDNMVRLAVTWCWVQVLIAVLETGFKGN
jgi:hypothetical protein